MNERQFDAMVEQIREEHRLHREELRAHREESRAYHERLREEQRAHREEFRVYREESRAYQERLREEQRADRAEQKRRFASIDAAIENDRRVTREMLLELREGREMLRDIRHGIQANTEGLLRVLDVFRRNDGPSPASA